jgi:hypothetical protein
MEYLKIVGLVVLGLVLAPIVFGIFVLFALLFIIPWVLGVRFKITQNNKVIGYLRWAKFTRI